MRAFVAGASGFVGRRLTPPLIEDGWELRCLTREPEALDSRLGSEAVVGGELERPESYRSALEGCEVAYYLVHLLRDGDGYAQRERAAAELFAREAKQAGVGRVVYLGGLGGGDGSRHLRSREATAAALEQGGPPLTHFRAAMIIGPGSESYALLRGIVARLPALPDADWLQARTQPIGVRDVVAYLRQAPDIEASRGREVEIGGPDVLTHLDVVDEMARQLGRRAPRRFRVFGATPNAVAAGAARVTHGSSAVAAEIAHGLPQPSVIEDPSGAALFPIRPDRLSVALQRAIEDEEREAEAVEA